MQKCSLIRKEINIMAQDFNIGIGVIAKVDESKVQSEINKQAKNVKLNVETNLKLDKKILDNQISTYMNKNTKATKIFGDELTILQKKLDNVDSSQLKDIKKQLIEFEYTEIEITDMLIKYLYGIKNSKSKESLWFCYGNIIFENLKKNIGNKTSVCEKCGKRFEKDSPAQKRCVNCQGYQPIETKIIKCIDCGKEIVVDSRNVKTKRCELCQKEKDKSRKREWKRKQDSKK
jgi:hypothetical protein